MSVHVGAALAVELGLWVGEGHEPVGGVSTILGGSGSADSLGSAVGCALAGALWLQLIRCGSRA